MGAEASASDVQSCEPLRIRVARAIYNRHWTSASPVWANMSPGFQRWMLEQADAALLEIEVSREEY